MIDAGFVTNINYVTRTVQATKDLILSIEDDLHDVRTLIRNRVTDQVDRQQLIQLLEQENVELKSRLDQKDVQIEALQTFLNSLEEEKSQQQESYEQEIQQLQGRIEQLQQEKEDKNEKLLFSEGEIERILNQCNQAMAEKEKIFTKAKELDDYCNQIEAQVTQYHTQATTLQQEKDQLTKKLQQIEKANKKKQGELEKEYQTLYDQYLADTEQLQQQLKTLQDDHQLLGQEKAKVDETMIKNQEEFQSQYNHLYDEYEQSQQQLQQLTEQHQTDILEERQSAQQQLLDQKRKYENDIQSLVQRHRQEMSKQQYHHREEIMLLEGKHHEDILRLSQRKSLHFSEKEEEEEEQVRLSVSRSKEFEKEKKTGKPKNLQLHRPESFTRTLGDSSLESTSTSSPINQGNLGPPPSSSFNLSQESIEDQKRNMYYTSAEEVEVTEIDQKSTSLDDHSHSKNSSNKTNTISTTTNNNNNNNHPVNVQTSDDDNDDPNSVTSPLHRIPIANTISEERFLITKSNQSSNTNPTHTTATSSSHSHSQPVKKAKEPQPNPYPTPPKAKPQTQAMNLDTSSNSKNYQKDVDRSEDDGSSYREFYKSYGEEEEDSYPDDQRVTLSPNRSHRNSLSHEVNHLEIIEEDEQEHIIHAMSSDDIVLKAREEYDTNENRIHQGFIMAMNPHSLTSSPTMSRLSTPQATKKGFFLNPFDEFDFPPDGNNATTTSTTPNMITGSSPTSLISSSAGHPPDASTVSSTKSAFAPTTAEGQGFASLYTKSLSSSRVEGIGFEEETRVLYASQGDAMSHVGYVSEEASPKEYEGDRRVADGSSRRIEIPAYDEYEDEFLVDEDSIQLSDIMNFKLH